MGKSLTFLAILAIVAVTVLVPQPASATYPVECVAEYSSPWIDGWYGGTVVNEHGECVGSGQLSTLRAYVGTAGPGIIASYYQTPGEGTTHRTCRDWCPVTLSGTGWQTFTISLHIHDGDYLGWYTENIATGRIYKAGWGTPYGGVYALGADPPDIGVDIHGTYYTGESLMEAWGYAEEGVIGTTLHTDNATGIGPFDATLNGEVTAIATDYNVKQKAYVWDTDNHTDPGNTAPSASDYANYENVSISPAATSPFSWAMTLSSENHTLLPATTYYFRFGIQEGPFDDWVYGDELSFMTLGLETPTVQTDNASSIVYPTAQLNGQILDVGVPSDNCDTWGFEWGSSSGVYTDNWADTGSKGVASFSHSDSFGQPRTYYRAMAHNPTSGWGYGAEVLFKMLLPPKQLVATPVTGTEIDLTWNNPNIVADWPNLLAVIRMEDGEYPDDPPSLVDNSTLIFQQLASPAGDHAYTVNGLTPGTTYYFRIWFYDSVEGYTDYDEDFATVYSGVEPPDDHDTPPNWFIDPTCDSWENVPMIMTIINGINTKYGFPTNYLCMIINLFLLSCAMTTSYGGTVAVKGQPTGTGTILVPFIVMCAGFLIGPVIGAFPGFFLAIGVIIGIGVAFAWSRA